MIKAQRARKSGCLQDVVRRGSPAGTCSSVEVLKNQDDPQRTVVADAGTSQLTHIQWIKNKKKLT